MFRVVLASYFISFYKHLTSVDYFLLFSPLHTEEIIFKNIRRQMFKAERALAVLFLLKLFVRVQDSVPVSLQALWLICHTAPLRKSV